MTPGGIISTVVGTGTFGTPADGSQASSQPFSQCNGIAFDSAGDMYLTSANYSQVYRVTRGVIRSISGGGRNPLTEGSVATSTTGFFGRGLRADAMGDVYVVDFGSNVIRKLILNTPASLRIVDGDRQSGPVGQALDKPLRVQLMGRAGGGISGANVTFAVTSGSAALSALTTQTDATGTAGIGVTLGSAAGPVVITASATGTSFTAEFNLEATAGGGGSCSVSAPAITSVRSLTDFGGLTTFAAGSWLEVKGTNLATNTRIWSGTEFTGANAPTSLDGTRVSIGGRASFVYFISPTQVNVQAPDDDRTRALPVTLSNCAGTSPAFTAQKSTLAPGMLAPSSFNVGGRQYLVALHSDGATYVGPVGLISGVAFAPAKPGDSIVAYGVGFGPVTPSISAGVVVSESNAIPGLTIRFGQTPAAITFAGLAPGNIGLYQFNIRVPEVGDGDQAIAVSIGGVAVGQTLYLTVRR